jgi:2-polyprenyl-6-methoxyphenol hydroxylase-like FAD-dependent oxidoreductase
LIRTPLAGAMEDAFGAPHTHIHRADLLRALTEALPEARLHTGRALVRTTDHGDQIEVQFKDGDRIEADILIGADGIHSATRSQLFGPARPHFTGSACYRGLAPAAAVAHPDIPLEAQVWLGPGRHFVHYFLRGGAFLNFVAVVDQDARTAEFRTDATDIHEARTHFKDWHTQIRGILDAVEKPSSGRCSTARACPPGPKGAQRRWGMRATRWRRSWPKAPRRRSRMARRLPPACLAPRIVSRPSRPMKRCACRAPRGCRDWPRATRPGFTCRTVPRRSPATRTWRGTSRHVTSRHGLVA